MDNNCLRSLAFTLKLPQWRQISCVNNKIENIAGLRNCTKLQVVDVSGNAFKNFFQVQNLAHLEYLSHLSLQSHPLPQELYRRRVIYRIQQLVNLDGQEITDKEIISTLNFYGADLKDHMEVFASVYPDKEFESVVDPYIEEELQLGATIGNFSGEFVHAAVDRAYEARPEVISSRLVSDVLAPFLTF